MSVEGCNIRCNQSDCRIRCKIAVRRQREFDRRHPQKIPLRIQPLRLHKQPTPSRYDKNQELLREMTAEYCRKRGIPNPYDHPINVPSSRRPMTGLWQTYTAAEKQRILDYDGPQDFGDPSGPRVPGFQVL